MTKLTALFVFATSLVAAHIGSSAPLTDAQKEAFLATAEIQRLEPIGIGVTGSMRATLANGSFTHDAHIQTIDDFQRVFSTEDGYVEYNFRDYHAFNVAAYRLDRLIGLNLVPVSVIREINGQKASVTWWVDDVKMMAKERRDSGAIPPNVESYNDQMYNVRVFNELVFNIDAHLRNLLITEDWQIRPIDFTRSFRESKRANKPKNLVKIDRYIYNALKGLTEERLRSKLDDLLTNSQIKGLMGRRDWIIKYFDKKAAEHAGVICDHPGRWEAQ